MRCIIYYTIIHPNGIIVVNFYSCSMKDREYVLLIFSDNLFALSHVFSKHNSEFTDFQIVTVYYDTGIVSIHFGVQ